MQAELETHTTEQDHTPVTEMSTHYDGVYTPTLAEGEERMDRSAGFLARFSLAQQQKMFNIQGLPLGL